VEVSTLLKKIRRTGTIDRQPGSVRVNENIENVEVLVLSQNAPIDSWDRTTGACRRMDERTDKLLSQRPALAL